MNHKQMINTNQCSHACEQEWSVLIHYNSHFVTMEEAEEALGKLTLQESVVSKVAKEDADDKQKLLKKKTNEKENHHEETQVNWKWWEEEKKDDGTKWKFLEHKGPVFPPPYEPLPSNVRFFYDGKEVRLSQDAEEVAGFYARMLDHEYTTKSAFNNNFFKDWRKVMTPEETKLIKDLSKCNFKEMQAYYLSVSEKNKNRSKEEKKAFKLKNKKMLKKYGFCAIDGHKEKVGNFRIESPGLFRGHGEHTMGKVKRRLMPEDVIINCSKDSKIPEAPPGHEWKQVQHDNTITMLASWRENVRGQVRYVKLHSSSKLKGEIDKEKYENARKLNECIDKIRDDYRADWKAKEMHVRQRGVALYFIDRLALRAGNETGFGQDTVGCCSLRVEHIKLHRNKDGKEYVVVFDFLGKSNVKYYNCVIVKKCVFNNLKQFTENKNVGDKLFDKLTTIIANKYLKTYMKDLSAKVFRTYNASKTMQNELKRTENVTLHDKIFAYDIAIHEVAVLCNHKHHVSKERTSRLLAELKKRINAKLEYIEEEQYYKMVAREEFVDDASSSAESLNDAENEIDSLRKRLHKLESQTSIFNDNKAISSKSSKESYVDPRISVAWCKKHGVPIEAIFTKTQRDKFRWAIEMAGPDFVF